MDSNPAWEPEGPLINLPPATIPTLTTSSHLRGTYISLIPLSISHTPSLFRTLGGATHAQIFKYLPSGPYFTLASFSVWIENLVNSGDFMYSIVRPSQSHLSSQLNPKLEETANERGGRDEEILGVACYSAPTPQHHAIEIGIILSPLLHQSTAGTEISYLLLNHAFSLGYQRVEWRCNERNEASKRAAERLGFMKEGVLRRQQAVKGRERDTAIYGMLGEEWEIVKAGLEKWLQEGNFEGGRQRRRLQDFRRQVGREEREGEC